MQKSSTSMTYNMATRKKNFIILFILVVYLVGLVSASPSLLSPRCPCCDETGTLKPCCETETGNDIPCCDKKTGKIDKCCQDPDDPSCKKCEDYDKCCQDPY